MSYDDYAKSVRGSRPIEVWLVVTPGDTYRYTSANVDVVFDSNTYMSVPSLRGNLVSASASDPAEMEFTVPASLDVVLDNAFGVPYRDMRITITSIEADGSSKQIYDGEITSITIEGDEAKMRSPGPLGDALNTSIPAARVQRLCNHPLYGTMCTVVRAGFKLSTTASVVSGIHVTPASIGGHYVTWFQFGEVVRVADSERRTIMSDLAGILTLDMPFRVLHVSDAIDLYAGCDRSLTGLNGCDPKFSNAINFGGHPYVPTENPFVQRLTGRNWRSS